MTAFTFFRTTGGGHVRWSWMLTAEWDAMSDAGQTAHRDELIRDLIREVEPRYGASNSVVPFELVPGDVRGPALAGVQS